MNEPEHSVYTKVEKHGVGVAVRHHFRNQRRNQSWDWERNPVHNVREKSLTRRDHFRRIGIDWRNKGSTIYYHIDAEQHLGSYYILEDHCDSYCYINHAKTWHWKQEQLSLSKSFLNPNDISDHEDEHNRVDDYWCVVA